MTTTALSNTTPLNENLETYSLIWLDASVNNSHENQQAQLKLRSVINHLITFENDQECLQYIQNLPNGDRIVLIVNGRFGRKLVPQIVNLQQIASIYIYCFDKKVNEQWSRQFTKVKGVITRLSELINQIKEDYIKQQHIKLDESLTIQVYNSNEGQTFIHSQLLIDCLIRMKSLSNDRSQLISFCREYYKNNYAELMIIKEFEEDYSPDQSVWWYTRHSFLYRLLNKAFRMQNIDLLYLFRFVIRDIGCQLGENRCLSPIRVYRNQLMSNEELEILKNSMGGFISMNSFLSTNVNREQTRSILLSANPPQKIEKVFFEIDADPRLNNIKPFSDITSQSYFPKNKEVLFMIGSIFRLVQIQHDDDKIWTIRIALCSADDHRLKSVFRNIKNELGVGETGLLRFGHVLRQMGKCDKAEKYYRRYLNQLPNDHPEMAHCYHAFGKIAELKKDFVSSLKWYNKSLEIFKQTPKSNDLNIADTYNDIANVYLKIGDYTCSIELYLKALEIWKRTLGENHPRVAKCLNNIGAIYETKKKYSMALECYQKALSISKKTLPSCHPDIAITIRNIGNVYELNGDRRKALSYYKKTAKIYRHALPSTHPYVADTKKNIHRVLSKLK